MLKSFFQLLNIQPYSCEVSNTTVFFTGALEVLIEMKKQDIPFNKETYLLAFAICYKLVSTSNSQDKNILEIPSLCLPFFF